MSTDGEMEKEDVVHVYNEILVSHEKNEIMPFAMTWMDLGVSKSDKGKHHMISLLCRI